jgi:phosphoribosylformylglycinamidine cyclo-ligase
MPEPDNNNTKSQKKGLTYADSGVDIEAEANIISELVSQFKTNPVDGLGKPIDLPGHFTGIIEFGDYALSLCTDGVGTKILIANELKKWDTIGIDCMAMNVNDMICIGARPVAFVDYLALEEPSENIVREIGKGLAKGAELSGVNIIGGETATLKGMINGVDLAGTCLGYVKRSEIITGERIAKGDSIIGLASSGIHSNGLTLARSIVERQELKYTDPCPAYSGGKSIGEVLLTPTRIYVKEILDIINNFDIHGLANITGGGLKNILRLKENVHFEVTDPMPVPDIFKLLADWGNVDHAEMHQTFNMGLGFCIVLAENDSEELIKKLPDDYKAKIIGRIEEGSGLAVPSLGLNY